MDVELPSRNAFPSCRFQWMREKAALDRARVGEGESEDAQRLWIYAGKLYDLERYVGQHPGGREFLELTQGMDVTALVESHHLNRELVQQVLKKYYVRDTKNAGTAARKAKAEGKPVVVEDFSWAEDGFLRTIQRRARAALGETRAARGPTTEMRVIVWLTLLAWVGAFAAMCVVRTETRVPALAAGFFLYVLLGMGHNGMHTAHPWWKYLMDLSLFSHVEWTISHCLSHHHWPNTQVDFEISAIEPFVWSLASKAGHKHRYLPLYLWGTLCIFGPFELVGRISNICRGTQPLRPENLLPLLQLALAVWGQGDWGVGFRRWLLMHVVSSVLMGAEALPLHHSDHSWTDGKPAPRPIDFGAHVLATTQDYAIISRQFSGKMVLLLLLLPFNHHRLHHLLPAIDESRLPELEPILQETCAEFGQPYRLYSWWELASGCARNWLDLPSPPGAAMEKGKGEAPDGVAGAGASPPGPEKKKTQ